jgi:hypothetical protein
MKKRTTINVLDGEITTLISLCQVSMEVGKAANLTPESEKFLADFAKGENYSASVIQYL